MIQVLKFRTDQRSDNYTWPLAVFLFVVALLSIVQLKMASRPIILLERFVHRGGWIEILFLGFYGSYVFTRMQHQENVARWRRITWTIFSVVFFLQLIIGILGASKFLMTGRLHLPVPMMILAGPLYRGHLSVMTILFLSTIILTGPAWCSQLCYFGAFDSLAAIGKTRKGTIKYKTAMKTSLLFLIIMATLVLRWLNVPLLAATITAVGFGLGGIVVMILFSRRAGKMIHCVLYCPIGTMVSLFKPVNPFRLTIDSNCNLCMKCTTYCKYDALGTSAIHGKKPSYSCTLCGDCLAACHSGSIKYRFFKLKPETARNLYLFLTVSLHAVFLALARI